MKMRLSGFVVSALLAICSPAHAVSPGEPAPRLEAQDQSGAWQRIDSFRGKVVYIDFWASWCAPCRRSMPVLDRLSAQWSDDLIVLGVNVDAEKADALAFLKKTQVHFPIVFDPGGGWAERFAAPGMPTGYLIDRDGIVRHVNVGYRASELSELENLIKRTVEGGT